MVVATQQEAIRAGYKQTEVGVIPENWEVKILGSVLSRCHLGGNYPNQDGETSYPLMKMGNIDRGYIDTDKVEYISSDVMPDPLDRLRYGDILFNTRNTLDLVGKVAIWRNELPVAYFNSNLMRLEFNPDEVCSNEYANYALNSPSGISRLRALATGTTSVAAIYTRDLLQLPFIVPPPSEQRAIAAALSDVDALVASLDLVLTKKRNIKTAALQQLLTGERRLAGFRGEWRVKRLGTVLKFQVGFPFSSVFFNQKDNGIRLVKNRDLKSDELIYHYSGKYAPTYLVVDGDVLIGMDGDFMPCLWRKGSALLNQRVGRIVVSTGMDRTFAYYFLLEPLKAIETVTSSTTVKHLSHGDVENIERVIPAMEEQTAIATILSDMDGDIAALEARRDKAQALRQGMMQQLLTGNIRLV